MKPKRRLKIIASGIVIFYVVILLVSCGLQERFIFFPDKLAADHSYHLTPPDTEITLKTSDGATINAIHYHNDTNKRLVIYFHGNAGCLDSWRRVSTEILSLGCDMIIIDYRSYGKSTGKMSEKGLYADAEAAFSYALAKGYTENQIIFYGRSLGTGIATEMAYRHTNAKALILEAPYTSVANRAQEQYPVLLPKLYLRYRLDNLKKAPKLKVPALVLHGTADEVIPYAHGKKLFEAIASQKKMISFEGGKHGNLSSFPEHRKGIKDFLDSL